MNPTTSNASVTEPGQARASLQINESAETLFGGSTYPSKQHQEITSLFKNKNPHAKAALPPPKNYPNLDKCGLNYERVRFLAPKGRSGSIKSLEKDIFEYLTIIFEILKLPPSPEPLHIDRIQHLSTQNNVINFLYYVTGLKAQGVNLRDIQKLPTTVNKMAFILFPKEALRVAPKIPVFEKTLQLTHLSKVLLLHNVGFAFEDLACLNPTIIHSIFLLNAENIIDDLESLPELGLLKSTADIPALTQTERVKAFERAYFLTQLKGFGIEIADLKALEERIPIKDFLDLTLFIIAYAKQLLAQLNETPPRVSLSGMDRSRKTHFLNQCFCKVLLSTQGVFLQDVSRDGMTDTERDDLLLKAPAIVALVPEALAFFHKRFSSPTSLSSLDLPTRNTIFKFIRHAIPFFPLIGGWHLSPHELFECLTFPSVDFLAWEITVKDLLPLASIQKPYLFFIQEKKFIKVLKILMRQAFKSENPEIFKALHADDRKKLLENIAKIFFLSDYGVNFSLFSHEELIRSLDVNFRRVQRLKDEGVTGAEFQLLDRCIHRNILTRHLDAILAYQPAIIRMIDPTCQVLKDLSPEKRKAALTLGYKCYVISTMGFTIDFNQPYSPFHETVDLSFFGGVRLQELGFKSEEFVVLSRDCPNFLKRVDAIVDSLPHVAPVISPDPLPPNLGSLNPEFRRDLLDLCYASILLKEFGINETGSFLEWFQRHHKKSKDVNNCLEYFRTLGISNEDLKDIPQHIFLSLFLIPVEEFVERWQPITQRILSQSPEEEICPPKNELQHLISAFKLSVLVDCGLSLKCIEKMPPADREEHINKCYEAALILCTKEIRKEIVEQLDGSIDPLDFFLITEQLIPKLSDTVSFSELDPNNTPFEELPNSRKAKVLSTAFYSEQLDSIGISAKTFFSLNRADNPRSFQAAKHVLQILKHYRMTSEDIQGVSDSLSPFPFQIKLRHILLFITTAAKTFPKSLDNSRKEDRQQLLIRSSCLFFLDQGNVIVPAQNLTQGMFEYGFKIVECMLKRGLSFTEIEKDDPTVGLSLRHNIHFFQRYIETALLWFYPSFTLNNLTSMPEEVYVQAIKRSYKIHLLIKEGVKSKTFLILENLENIIDEARYLLKLLPALLEKRGFTDLRSQNANVQSMLLEELRLLLISADPDLIFQSLPAIGSSFSGIDECTDGEETSEKNAELSLNLPQNAPLTQNFFSLIFDQTNYFQNEKPQKTLFDLKRVQKFGKAAFATEAIEENTYVLPIEGSFRVIPKKNFDLLPVEQTDRIYTIGELKYSELPEEGRQLLAEKSLKAPEYLLTLEAEGPALNLLHDSRPNLTLKHILDNTTHQFRFGFVARRKIWPNEPLTINYGNDDFWQAKGTKPKPLKHFWLQGLKVSDPLHLDPQLHNLQNHLMIKAEDNSLRLVEEHPLILQFFKEFAHLSKKLPPLPNKYKPSLESLLKGAAIPEHLCVRQLDFGLGIFLQGHAKKISAGELLGVYSGVLNLLSKDPTSGFDYCFEVGTVKVPKEVIRQLEEKGYVPASRQGEDPMEEITIEVDATLTGNFSKYINHASNQFANVECGVYCMDSLPVICLFAKQDIEPNHQLLMDYRKGYWSNKPFAPITLHPTSHLDTKNLEDELL